MCKFNMVTNSRDPMVWRLLLLLLQPWLCADNAIMGCWLCCSHRITGSWRAETVRCEAWVLLLLLLLPLLHFWLASTGSWGLPCRHCFRCNCIIEVSSLGIQVLLLLQSGLCRHGGICKQQLCCRR